MGDLITNSEITNAHQIHRKSPLKHPPSHEMPYSPSPVRYDTPSPAPSAHSQDSAIRRITDVRYHLELCAQTLLKLEEQGKDALHAGEPVTVGVSPVTIRTVAACLSELLKLEWTQPHRDSCHDLCKLLDCPQQPVLREAILHTIEVLETTKFRFKSKELKRLRESLEILLGNSRDYLPAQES